MSEAGQTPETNASTLAGITQYIAKTAFTTYIEHIGEEFTPELAGSLAVEIGRLVEPEIASAIAGEFSEVPVKFVGVGEIADILGVTKQRVHQLARTEKFPEPIARLRATPVWTESDVIRFKAEHRSR